jgi:HEAT repeat protein
MKLEDLLKQLNSSNSRDQVVALVTIGQERRYSAIPQVVATLKDRHHEVRAMAAWALDLLRSPETVPALIEALHDPVFEVRSNAGWALVHLAQRVFPNLVLPDVIDVLKDDDNEDARQMAYLVLLHVGGAEAEDAINQYWR